MEVEIKILDPEWLLPCVMSHPSTNEAVIC